MISGHVLTSSHDRKDRPGPSVLRCRARRANKVLHNTPHKNIWESKRSRGGVRVTWAWTGIRCGWLFGDALTRIHVVAPRCSFASITKKSTDMQSLAESQRSGSVLKIMRDVMFLHSAGHGRLAQLYPDIIWAWHRCLRDV